ncbi:MAG: VWA domain-containing protein [Acidobacteria bacterium]|nr:VWA domain-containing protein [Acidobacteriota bacterium]
MLRSSTLKIVLLIVLALPFACAPASAQPPEKLPKKAGVRTVTIPISIFTKRELREGQLGEFVAADRLIVKEDGDEQEVLSIRSIAETPLSVAFLIQDNLASEFNLELREIANFIRSMPKGTRVMVAYGRGGTVQIVQKFTDNTEAAAATLHLVAPTISSQDPYNAVEDILGKFDALPAGRRALVLFSDGLDTSQGTSLSETARTYDLEQAITKAQKKSIAVYSVYAPSAATQNNPSLATGGQAALDRLSTETGGRSLVQGSGAVSLIPYFKDLGLSLARQFSLTYMSTHMKKGFHRVSVTSSNPDVRVEHPKGYYYR